jgi:hypothetical protein
MLLTFPMGMVWAGCLATNISLRCWTEWKVEVEAEVALVPMS